VTGSCHLLQANGLNIMIDCGLTQGNDTALPIKDWPVKPSKIDFLFMTHAHIDHAGKLPELIRKGFNGEIICTLPTRDLLFPMLHDSMGFENMNEKEVTELSKKIDELTWGFEYGQSFELDKGIKFKLGRAGHILGSCFIRFEIKNPGVSILFSGDLGSVDSPILPDPDIPDEVDYLIVESTYGNRLHDDRKGRKERLGRILSKALADQGKVFIPAFALGRTQELIYEMDRLFSASEYQNMFTALNPETLIPKNRPPVFIDTPLGLEITKIYSRLSEYWDAEANDLYYNGDHPIDFGRLYGVKSHKHHLDLINMPGPAIILAGSGMCNGGRIINHLKAGIEDPKNNICFAGYQAKGTPGRTIRKYGNKPGGYVYLDGKKKNIKAEIDSLSGYSAHADQKGLIEWICAIPEKPGEIKLVHGEPVAQAALADELKKRGFRCC